MACVFVNLVLASRTDNLAQS